MIMDCLPHGPLTTSVRVALAVSLVVSYPVMLFPVSEILEGLTGLGFVDEDGVSGGGQEDGGKDGEAKSHAAQASIASQG